MLINRVIVYIFSLLGFSAFGIFLLYQLDIFTNKRIAESIALNQTNIVGMTTTNIINQSIREGKDQISVEDLSNSISVLLGEQKSFKQYGLIDMNNIKDPVDMRVINNKTTEFRILKMGILKESRLKISTPIIIDEISKNIIGIFTAQYILDSNLKLLMDHVPLQIIFVLIVMALIFCMIVVILSNLPTKILGNIKMAIQAAIEGDFRSRVIERSDGIFREVAEIINYFLDVLEKYINTIDVKIASIFVYNKSYYSRNPLSRINELIAEITNLFLFKNTIEIATTTKDVYHSLHDQIYRCIKFDQLIIAEKINDSMGSNLKTDNEREFSVSLGELLGIENRLTNTKASIIFNGPRGCFFVGTSEESFNVFDIKCPISDDVTLYISILLNSKKEYLRYENAISRIYNYLREARPTISNILLRKSIEESSYIDALTKAYNRTYLEIYSSYLSENIRQGKSFAILMLDIDKFKNINDTYGHAIGDIAIVLIVETIKKLISPEDKLFRYGGEEFVVVLDGKDLNAGFKIGEKIREAFIVNKKCSHGEIDFPKSVSVGVSAMPDFGVDIYDAINQADLALYTAKEGGRNRTIRYSVSLEEGEHSEEIGSK